MDLKFEWDPKKAASNLDPDVASVFDRRKPSIPSSGQ